MTDVVGQPLSARSLKSAPYKSNDAAPPGARATGRTEANDSPCRTRSVRTGCGLPEALRRRTVGQPARSHARRDAFVNVKVSVNIRSASPRKCPAMWSCCTRQRGAVVFRAPNAVGAASSPTPMATASKAKAARMALTLSTTLPAAFASRLLAESVYECDEFVTAVTLVAGELDQLSGFCDKRALFGGACDADRAAAAHFKQALIPEKVQST